MRCALVATLMISTVGILRTEVSISSSAESSSSSGSPPEMRTSVISGLEAMYSMIGLSWP